MMNNSFFIVLVFCISQHVFSQTKEIPVLQLEVEQIERMDILNGPFRDTNPCLTPDGKYLYFMSGRGGQPWTTRDYAIYGGRYEPDGDIYYSKKDNGRWMPPECLGPTVNSDMAEDEPIITPDGQFVIFQSWKEGWDTLGGPYFKAELFGNVWGKSVGLGGGIHEFFIDAMEQNDWYYATDGAALSPNGTRFIFAAGKLYDQPLDLYMSNLKDGRWSYPKKLSLNTNFDERSVFFGADGKTLFFSSAGYGGFGKLDVFKTTINEDGSHGEIVNVGAPINTADNDFGFTMNLEGTDIYYTRNSDIFHIILSKPEQFLKPLPTLLISGIVIDYYGQPIESNIQLIDNQNKNQVGKAKSNSHTGEYALVVPKINGTYQKTIDANGFRSYNEEIIIEDGMPDIMNGSIDLLKRNNSELIFFDLNDEKLKPSEFKKLDSISSVLYQNKSYRLHLSGHADQTGTEAYNLELSAKRVERVKKYLTDKGIPERIIKTTYYGESKPMIQLPSPNELFLNRRVEVLIIYK